MALKTNFTDDILSESMNGKRQYNVTENSNGTKSLEDVTDYQSVGSTFSAKDMNETNAAVNQAYDDMGDEFNPEVDYAVGDYTIRNNKIWKFTTAHPAGAWDESHVKATKILSEARELTEKINGISGGVKYGYISIPAISYTAYGLKDITASFDVEFEKAPSMVFLFTNSKTSVMPVCCFDITARTLGVRLFQTRAESTTASANTYIRYIAIFD